METAPTEFAEWVLKLTSGVSYQQNLKTIKTIRVSMRQIWENLKELHESEVWEISKTGTGLADSLIFFFSNHNGCRRFFLTTKTDQGG